MGANWANLPENIRDLILSTTARKFPYLQSQGVSNVIYGMTLMMAKWEMPTETTELGRPNNARSSSIVLTVSSEFKDAACVAIADKMRKDSMMSGMLTPQAAANIIYCLGKITVALLRFQVSWIIF